MVHCNSLRGVFSSGIVHLILISIALSVHIPLKITCISIAHIATVNLCPFLEHPANGLVTVEDRSPESVATYSCNGGYSLKGSATRLCQSNGTWTNEPPMCVSGMFSTDFCLAAFTLCTFTCIQLDFS